MLESELSNLQTWTAKVAATLQQAVSAAFHHAYGGRGPLTDDVLKCVLKPFDPGAYTHALSQAQMLRLKAVFKQGVCDYGRAGIAQSAVSQTWLESVTARTTTVSQTKGWF
jgi:Tannase-like family of unknown function (DUF6351)